MNKKSYRNIALSLVLVMLLLVGSVFNVQVKAEEAAEFKDVPSNHTFYSSVTNLVDKGITEGYRNGYFGEDDPITRAQIAVMLVRAREDLNPEGMKADFKDVANNYWATPEIAAAHEAGILDGYEGGRFGPEDNVTRAQLSKMVANAFNIKIDPSNSASFTDVPPSYWAEEHISALASNEIVGGYKDRSFRPDENASRGQFAKYLSNTLNPELRDTTAGEDSTFEVHFIDVGQADSALILCDDQAMLIDGGNVADSSLIYSYLRDHKVEHLDYMICTHAHEDHVGGLSGALSYATVGTAYCPVTSYNSKAFRNFTIKLGEQNKSITVPSHGDKFTLGSAQCQIVGPIKHTNNTNNTSIVLKIKYGDTNFLFTGDAEEEEERDIMSAGYGISSDVLKVGHHGSDTSTRYLWLRTVAPKYAVISCSKNNPYGHPSEDVLSKLRDADVKVYRTDMQGHIISTSDGQNITFKVQRNPDADTLEGAGLGGDHNPTTPDENVVYITKTGSKYHRGNCRYLSKSKIEIGLNEAISKGYEPCKICKP